MSQASARRRWLSPVNAVVLTQFMSSFADNLNFFIIIGLIKRQGFDNPDQYVTYIQIGFLAVYVLLAPIVGAFADRNAKSGVLLVGNMFKALAILLMMVGLHPALCYSILGIGAVIYSPAKYGILTELTNTDEQLLKANSKIEGTTILAILLGTVAGGILAEISDFAGLITCFGIYTASILLTFLIPKKEGNKKLQYGESAKEFLKDTATLFKNAQANFSLIGTGAFWLTAAVLRIALVAWLPANLGITDTDQQSYIIGVTAVGVVVGSIVMPKLIPVHKMYISYVYGFLMVLSVMITAFMHNLILTLIMLFLIGVFGGVFLIPMNTILQNVGKDLVGAGKTIAVQNLVENALTITGLFIYLFLTSKIDIQYAVVGMGAILLAFVLYLTTRLGAIKASIGRATGKMGE